MKVIREAASYALIGALVFFLLFPIYWMVVSSFKPASEVLTNSPRWIFSPTLSNYVEGYRVIKLPLINSLIVALATTLISTTIGAMAAYSFSRFRFHGQKHLAFWILSVRMAPPIAMIIPIFLLMRSFHLVDTHLALIVTHLISTLPLAVWIMRGFFLDLPAELEEAAMIGGCSRFQALVRIVLPLSAPGLAVTAIFCFIFSWNEFLFATVLTRLRAVTLPVAISGFNTEFDILWGPMTASGIISFIPIFIFAILIQKHMVRGLTLGAIR